MFIESSAKAGFNVKALFRKLATALPGMEAAPNQPSTNCTYTHTIYTINSMQTLSHAFYFYSIPLTLPAHF